MNVVTEIDGDTATVHPLHASDRPRLAAKLLEAAGPGNARAIRSVSLKGGGRGYTVPVAVAEAAGLIPAETDSEFDSGGVADGIVPRTLQEPQGVYSPDETRAWLDAEAAFKEEQKAAGNPSPVTTEPTEPAKKAPAKKAPAKAAPRKAAAAKADTDKADSGASAADDEAGDPDVQ